MPSEQLFQMSQAAAQRLGLPAGFELYSPWPFAGMNQQSSRMAMQDQEFFYIENFIKVGNGNLRTVWDRGTALYTAPTGKQIVYFFAFNISTAYYFAVFLDDGTAVQVNQDTGVVTTISSVPNTFFNGGNLPACRQWGSQYLLISNNIASNNYWVWDGASLFGAGTLAPDVTITNSGSGYTSAPTVTIYGGSGGGATATATVANGFVTSVKITNPGSGYQVDELVQISFAGGGGGNSAILSASLAPSNVVQIIVRSGGSGYVSPVITISGGGGSGATATAILSGGIITGFVITNGGSGYTSTPTVTITDSTGTGAEGVAILTAGGVASISVVNGGSGYFATPSISFAGTGTGATAVANISGGVITSVTVTNAGSGYVAAPSVIVDSGSNTSAAATLSLMPRGISGNDIETYNRQVWLLRPFQQGGVDNNGTFIFSGPASLRDFGTSQGGGIYVSADSTLRSQYTAIRQNNGYLYPIGDSSVNYISNVNTSGVPATTTFNYQNADPQIGTSWRNTLADYSRTILFANKIGIFGLYGGSVEEKSDIVDKVFTNAVWPPTGITPSSAVANIFGIRTYMTLMTVTDPTTNAVRRMMLATDGTNWFFLSQSANLTFIGTQTRESDLFAWGTDGTSLFRLFSTPSATLNKKLSTKLYGVETQFIQKSSYSFFCQAEGSSQIALSVSVDTELYSLPIPVTCSMSATSPVKAFFSSTAGDVPGVNMGLTISSTTADFVIDYIGLGYYKQGAVLGSNGTTET